jgi:hypothetical protein
MARRYSSSSAPSHGTLCFLRAGHRVPALGSYHGRAIRFPAALTQVPSSTLCSLRAAASSARSLFPAHPCARIFPLGHGALLSHDLASSPFLRSPCSPRLDGDPLGGVCGSEGFLQVFHVSALLIGAIARRSSQSSSIGIPSVFPTKIIACARYLVCSAAGTVESRPPSASHCSLVRVPVGVMEFCFVSSSLTSPVSLNRRTPSSVASGLHAGCRRSSSCHVCNNVADSSMVLVDELHFINSSPSVWLMYARRTCSPFDPVSLELMLTCSTTPRQLAPDSISSSFRVSSRNLKSRMKMKLAVCYLPSARHKG